jgi:fused signal recognition particle receptor
MMSENEPKKRGFFSRLFGSEPEPAASPPTPDAVPPEAPLADAAIAPELLTGEAAPLPIAMPDPAPVQAASVPSAPVPAPEPKRSWWRRLTEGLSRTSSTLTTGITDLFTKRKLDAGTLEDLEDILIQADLGLATAARDRQGGRRGPLRQADRAFRGQGDPGARGRGDPGSRRPAARDRRHEKAVRDPDGRRQRLRQDHDDRQARGQVPGRGPVRHAGGRRHVPRRGHRAAQGLGRAGGREVVAREQGADAAGLAFEALQKAREPQASTCC